MDKMVKTRNLYLHIWPCHLPTCPGQIITKPMGVPMNKANLKKTQQPYALVGVNIHPNKALHCTENMVINALYLIIHLLLTVP